MSCKIDHDIAINCIAAQSGVFHALQVLYNEVHKTGNEDLIEHVELLASMVEKHRDCLVELWNYVDQEIQKLGEINE